MPNMMNATPPGAMPAKTKSSPNILEWLLVVLMLATLAGVGYLYLTLTQLNDSVMSAKSDVMTMKTELMAQKQAMEEKDVMATKMSGSVQYTCELSGGVFEGGSCQCPLEMGQTQEQVYDHTTGFCQSSQGGPAGNAFDASVGLPWGSFSYYHNIVQHWCEQSGGSRVNGTCNCSEGEAYNQTTGQCE